MGSLVKDRSIKKEEISMLLFNMIGSEIRMSDLSQWVKSKTEDEFVVIPREFCVLTLDFMETMGIKNMHKAPEIVTETLREFETLRKYL